MKIYPSINLKKDKENSLKRFHPWVFSGAIAHTDPGLVEGNAVEVFSYKKEFLGTGHYQPGTITVKILSFEQQELNDRFWYDSIKKAYDFRLTTGIADSSVTNVFRLIFAEGDSLPGLIIDYYNGTAVMLCYSLGMYNSRKYIADALIKVLGKKLQAIFDKSKDVLHSSTQVENEYLYGSKQSGEVKENGNKFIVDWEVGQKTGFFIDQRDNRQLLAHYAKNKTVLNTFSYTGGFSVYALNAGAKEVHSVDASTPAINMADINASMSNAPERHKSFVADVFDFLKNPEIKYDMVVLDPPAFAKHRGSSHNAVQGYKRLNSEAIKRIKSGGIIFTFSCSQVINKQLFHNTITAAAIEAKRNVRVLHQLSQPADHPVNIFHPEGEYLKGLVLYIE
jgi:23S rRNA (cytosine1962-C5)-methyltransferase